MAKGSSVWDPAEMREMFQAARASIFGAAKEKDPESTDNRSSTDHLDSDGEDIYS